MAFDIFILSVISDVIRANNLTINKNIEAYLEETVLTLSHLHNKSLVSSCFGPDGAFMVYGAKLVGNNNNLLLCFT